MRAFGLMQLCACYNARCLCGGIVTFCELLFALTSELLLHFVGARTDGTTRLATTQGVANFCSRALA